MLEEESVHPSVIEHACLVMSGAECLAVRCDANVDLVRAGALLHDIGRSRAHQLGHLTAGVRIAQRRGLSQELINIISRHVGAGLESEEAESLGLPPGEYVPQSLEEKIVAQVDNLVENDSIRSMEEVSREFRGKGLVEADSRMRALHMELSYLCGEDISDILRRKDIFSGITGPCRSYISRR